MQEDLQKELRFAAIWIIILDMIFWLGSLWLAGFTISVPLGLLLGSAGMMGNLLLLRNTVLNAVYHGKTKDIKGYLFRILIASAVIFTGLVSEHVHLIAAVVPFLYPKLIFGILYNRINKK